MATKYFKAIFADGTVLTRSTASRSYTHAWYARNPEHRIWSGFSGSEPLAAKAAAQYARWGYADTAVAEAVEIDAKAYRASKTRTGNPAKFGPGLED